MRAETEQLTGVDVAPAAKYTAEGKARAPTKRQTRSELEGFARSEIEPGLAAAAVTDAADRREIVDELIRIIQGIYVHLPLKQAMYGIDPVQQLLRLKERAASDELTHARFHAEIGRILGELRDAHTNYIGPMAIEGWVARLPFLIEQFGPETAPRFLVSKTIPSLIAEVEGIDEDAAEDEMIFKPGVEVVTWNGAPIADAVRAYGDVVRGGRSDSAMARAVDSMTFRPLGYLPIPIEHWVVVGYRTSRGVDHEIKLDWRFIRPGEGPTPVRPTEAVASAEAVHPDRSLIRRAKKLSFNAELWRQESVDRASGRVLPASRADVPVGEWITGRFQDNVSAKIEEVAGRQVGYLRLWSFSLTDDDGFVSEIVELLRLLPQDGLIVDLRGNPGGLIWAAERTLQLFTPRRVEPTRFSLLATDLTRSIADAPQNRRMLSPWRRSLFDALGTGELYSQGIPITPVERCNDRGQVYGGTVIAVVDATTYSAGDLFAAGFADNNIGTIVSVGRATGAGGANVWRSDVLRSILAGTDHSLGTLPGGVGFTMSVRRATRVGSSEGAPIEDLGIAGHRPYAMTERDLLEGNIDLLTMCARLIEAEPSTAMEVSADGLRIKVTSDRLDRIDVFVDDRPFTSANTHGDVAFQLLRMPESVRIDGYRGDLLEQSRRLVDHAGELVAP
ncbi:MAG: S41 family peptidase [Acidimicrobiia bacterium]|nr:S41 family peptidase [Acidimicrobiia bacterium]